MSSLGWLILLFFIFCFVMILVYFPVVRAFYWGDKKDPPKSRKGEEEKGRKGEK